MKRLPALLAAAGLLCAVVLEVVHYRAYVDPSASSFCSAGASVDCGSVALSPYSVVLGVPVPLWGVAGFAALLYAALAESAMLVPLSAFAALASLVLLGIEVVAIHSICLLCEGVHVASWALFFVAYRQRATSRPAAPSDYARTLGAGAAVLALAYVFTPPYWAMYSWRAGVRLPHGIDEQGHPWIGAETPKVTVHEYVDYACPHCALSASRTRRLLAKTSSSLRVVRHQMPRKSCTVVTNPFACVFSRGALCAGDQNRFWEMDSWLFEHAPGRADVDYDQAIRDLSLDGAKFHACLVAPATYARADAADHEARKAHIVEAPGYVIDGKLYTGKDVFTELQKRL